MDFSCNLCAHPTWGTAIILVFYMGKPGSERGQWWEQSSGIRYKGGLCLAFSLDGSKVQNTVETWQRAGQA